MKTHVLEREQWVPGTPERVFGFFADAGNLEAITPGWLGFRILSRRPIEMAERGFVDAQERGPYALWEHTHSFRPMGNGVLMADRVRYALPLGPLGALAHVVAVRSALAAIFDFRFRRVAEIFRPGGAD